MNRIIKFRAWDKHNREIRYPQPYCDGPDDVDCPENLRDKVCPSQLIGESGAKSHISDVLMNDELYVPMQYTGLNDKNGKEIYEGDIINFEGKKKFKIEFHFGAFCICLLDGRIDMSLFGFCENMPTFKLEVIGNIYENPKLLEGK